MTEDRESQAAGDARSPGQAHVGGKEAEPELRGTILLTTLLLIMIFGFWALMYLTLVNR